MKPSKAPVHQVCPASKEGYTHHLKPVYAGRSQYMLACEYCKKTEKEIRDKE